MNVVEFRQLREQPSTGIVEAPWRTARNQARLLLRSLRSRHALVAIKALPLRLFNLWIAKARRFRCALCAYLRFLCFYATLTATELRSVYYLPALKTFHKSILMFSSKCYSVRSRRANYIHRSGQEANGKVERYANSPPPHPRHLQTSVH